MEQVWQGKRVRPHAATRGETTFLSPSTFRFKLIEQQAAALFMEYISVNPVTTYSDSLYSVASFNNAFGTVCLPGDSSETSDGEQRLSKRDCEVLLKWLNRDCETVVTDGEVGLSGPNQDFLLEHTPNHVPTHPCDFPNPAIQRPSNSPAKFCTDCRSSRCSTLAR